MNTITRNYLKVGDRVLMKDGKVLTIKSLDFSDFICEEKFGYISKKNIKTVVVEQ